MYCEISLNLALVKVVIWTLNTLTVVLPILFGRRGVKFRSTLEYGHISKSVWPHGKNTRHELAQTLMVLGVNKQNLSNCFLDFSQRWSGAFVRGGFFNHLLLSRHVWPATVLFLQVDTENNFSSCFAFRWIPVNMRSYSHVEVWHGHFRTSDIILIPAGKLPCTLRESIFCSEEQKCFCIPCIFLSHLLKDHHHSVWEHLALRGHLARLFRQHFQLCRSELVNHKRLNDVTKGSLQVSPRWQPGPDRFPLPLACSSGEVKTADKEWVLCWRGSRRGAYLSLDAGLFCCSRYIRQGAPGTWVPARRGREAHAKGVLQPRAHTQASAAQVSAEIQSEWWCCYGALGTVCLQQEQRCWEWGRGVLALGVLRSELELQLLP